MRRNPTVYIFLLTLAMAAAAFAAPPAPQALPAPLPAVTAAGSSDCPPADPLVWLDQLSPQSSQAPVPEELPGILARPQPRIASCDPVRCSRLRGVCECDQYGNCFCVPV